MKVGAARPAGLPDVADDLALDDPAARPQPRREIPQVRVVRAVSPVVSEHDEVSVPVPASRERHDTVTGRLHPCSDRGSIVDPLMRAPLLENRVPARAESRGDTREFEGRAQECLAQIFALRGVIAAPSPGILKPYRAVGFPSAVEFGREHSPESDRFSAVVEGFENDPKTVPAAQIAMKIHVASKNVRKLDRNAVRK